MIHSKFIAYVQVMEIMCKCWLVHTFVIIIKQPPSPSLSTATSGGAHTAFTQHAPSDATPIPAAAAAHRSFQVLPSHPQTPFATHPVGNGSQRPGPPQTPVTRVHRLPAGHARSPSSHGRDVHTSGHPSPVVSAACLPAGQPSGTQQTPS